MWRWARTARRAGQRAWLVLAAHAGGGCAHNPSEADAQERARLALIVAADRSYAAAIEYCDARAAQILYDMESTPQQDREAYTALRARCDRAFRAFERVRTSSQTVEDLVQAITALEELQAGAPPTAPTGPAPLPPPLPTPSAPVPPPAP